MHCLTKNVIRQCKQAMKGLFKVIILGERNENADSTPLKQRTRECFRAGVGIGQSFCVQVLA